MDLGDFLVVVVEIIHETNQWFSKLTAKAAIQDNSSVTLILLRTLLIEN